MLEEVHTDTKESLPPPKKRRKQRVARFQKVKVTSENVIELLESGYYQKYNDHYCDGLASVKLQLKIKRMLLKRYGFRTRGLQKRKVHQPQEDQPSQNTIYKPVEYRDPPSNFTNVVVSTSTDLPKPESESKMISLRRPFIRRLYEILKRKGVEFERAKYLSQFLVERLLTFSTEEGLHHNFFNLLCFLYVCSPVIQKALPVQLNNQHFTETHLWSADTDFNT